MSTVETARGPADTAPTRTAVLIDFGGGSPAACCRR